MGVLVAVGVFSATGGTDSVVGPAGSPAVVGSSVCPTSTVGTSVGPAGAEVGNVILNPLHARRAVTNTAADSQAVNDRVIFLFISSSPYDQHGWIIR
jgi:hypothetical protein